MTAADGLRQLSWSSGAGRTDLVGPLTRPTRVRSHAKWRVNGLHQLWGWSGNLVDHRLGVADQRGPGGGGRHVGRVGGQRDEVA
jgi:hypothetical protein